jgi:hypothetical protein
MIGGRGDGYVNHCVSRQSMRSSKERRSHFFASSDCNFTQVQDRVLRTIVDVGERNDGEVDPLASRRLRIIVGRVETMAVAFFLIFVSFCCILLVRFD